MAGEGASGQPERPQTFAEKLTRLLNVMHPPGKPPMSDRTLARRITDQGGAISAGYVAELRTGRKTNPTLDHVRQIAAAFGIRPGYFLDEQVAEQVDRELDKLERRHRTDRLQELAASTASLDATDRELLAGLVEKELAKESIPGSSEPARRRGRERRRSGGEGPGA